MRILTDGFNILKNLAKGLIITTINLLCIAGIVVLFYAGAAVLIMVATRFAQLW
jgi:hypothetical protein